MSLATGAATARDDRPFAAGPDPDPLALLDLQCGLLTRPQLHSLGMDSRVIHRKLLGRRWSLATRRVVAMQTGPLSPGQRRWAAILHCGRSAALAAWTAAAEWGLQGWVRDAVHVLVPANVHPPAVAWVVVHQSRRFGPQDIHPARTPAQTPIARSVCDAAFWSDSVRSACGILAAAVQQQLVTAAALRAEVAAVRAGRQRHQLLLALDEIDAGSHSVAEIDAARLFRKAGLPRPARQTRRPDSDGRLRYTDLAWRLPGGRWLVVEVDGGLHMALTQWSEDQLRANAMVIGSDVVIRFPALLLTTDPARCVDQLRQAMLAHGLL